MLDERATQNRIDQVAAAPDKLLVMGFYSASDRASFEQQWQELTAIERQQQGSIWSCLHYQIDGDGNAPTYITYDLWDTREALIKAIHVLAKSAVYPLTKETRQIFMRLKPDVTSTSVLHSDNAGQVASIRIFDLKVGTEAQFERLWVESARHEVKHSKVLYKRLHQNLHKPTQYVSYSLWADRAAPDEAAKQHPHYQQGRKPYPLTDPVQRYITELVYT
jgi:hypothetical protein